jgi:hypothetical protein
LSMTGDERNQSFVRRSLTASYCNKMTGPQKVLGGVCGIRPLRRGLELELTPRVYAACSSQSLEAVNAAPAPAFAR